MADAKTVHIGENSPEFVAYRLMKDIRAAGDRQAISADAFLDLYAECLSTVTNPHPRSEKYKKSQPR
jgi:hypothetical protein